MALRAAVDSERQSMNTLNKAIGLKKRAKEECTAQVAESKALKAKVAQMEVKLEELASAIKGEMPKIGNLVHESVPVSNDEEKDSQCPPRLCRGGLLRRAARAARVGLVIRRARP